MRLVAGVAVQQPARDKGWSWLLDTERVHETIGCAIVDTAHVLVVDALAKGDLAWPVRQPRPRARPRRTTTSAASTS